LKANVYIDIILNPTAIILRKKQANINGLKIAPQLFKFLRTCN